MPITHCPSCQASLEVPPVVPGGVVACPYCGVEFPVKGGRRGGRGPVRRGRDQEPEEERGAPRYRKRADPVPLIIVCLVLLAGAVIGVVWMNKSKKFEQETEAARQQTLANVPRAELPISRTPDMPGKDVFDLLDVFNPNDKVTIQKFIHSAALNHTAYQQPRKGIVHRTLEFKTADQGETVTAFENDQTTHVGTYNIGSYMVDGRSVFQGPFTATFRLDRRGRLVPGSFAQTGGGSVSPPPEMIGDRNFGVLPDRPVRYMETYGTDTLPDPFTDHITIDGRPFRSLGVRGARDGGWRISGGLLERRESDMKWTHKASIDFNLLAAEKGVLTNFTFQGQPAELSYGMRWKGDATYLLERSLLVQVKALTVEILVRVKTASGWHDWNGSWSVDFQMLKDP